MRNRSAATSTGSSSIMWLVKTRNDININNNNDNDNSNHSNVKCWFVTGRMPLLSPQPSESNDWSEIYAPWCNYFSAGMLAGINEPALIKFSFFFLFYSMKNFSLAKIGPFSTSILPAGQQERLLACTKSNSIILKHCILVENRYDRTLVNYSEE